MNRLLPSSDLIFSLFSDCSSLLADNQFFFSELWRSDRPSTSLRFYHVWTQEMNFWLIELLMCSSFPFQLVSPIVHGLIVIVLLRLWQNNNQVLGRRCDDSGGQLIDQVKRSTKKGRSRGGTAKRRAKSDYENGHNDCVYKPHWSVCFLPSIFYLSSNFSCSRSGLRSFIKATKLFSV